MAARVLLVVLIVIVLAAVGFAVWFMLARQTLAGGNGGLSTGAGAAPTPTPAGTVYVLAPSQHAVTTQAAPISSSGGLSIGGSSSGTDMLGELRLL